MAKNAASDDSTRLDEARQRVLIEADQAKETLREFWFRAKRANDPVEADSLRNELSGIIDDLKQTASGCSTEPDLDSVKTQIEWVLTQRAYLAPATSLAIEAQGKISAMMEWGIPEEVKARMNAMLQGITAPGASDIQRRFVLEQLYDEYNYWDSYKDWFLEESLTTLSSRFSKIFFGTLAASLIFFLGVGWSILGFLFAGTAGASLSILLKLPPMTVYAGVADSSVRMYVRMLVGIAAATIGYGLLATGVINLGIPTGNGGQMVSLPSLAQQCTGDFSLGQIAERVSRPALAGAAPSGPASAGGSPTTTPNPCNASGVMLLLAIGMLLGFSERALTSFENLILPPTPAGSGSSAVKAQLPPQAGNVSGKKATEQLDRAPAGAAEDAGATVRAKKTEHGARDEPNDG